MIVGLEIRRQRDEVLLDQVDNLRQVLDDLYFGYTVPVGGEGFGAFAKRR